MNGMKKSTIKAVLRNKIKDWIASITDETLQDQLKKDTLVCGGAIASMLAGEKINDYDIYFRTFETAKAVADYYVSIFNSSNGNLKIASTVASGCNPAVKVEKKRNIKNIEEARIIVYIKSSGVASESQETYEYFETKPESATEDFISSLEASEDEPVETVQELVAVTKEKAKYRPIFLSENAITLSNKVQLVIRFFGEPGQIHDNYDFAHSMCYYDYAKDELGLHPEALEAVLSKTLIYKGSLYPIASLFRIRKFYERGWRITAGQMLKIVWQLQDVDLKNPEVLREQLLGVDQAYMRELLRALETTTERVDATYIAKLIDKIFE